MCHQLFCSPLFFFFSKKFKKKENKLCAPHHRNGHCNSAYREASLIRLSPEQHIMQQPSATVDDGHPYSIVQKTWEPHWRLPEWCPPTKEQERRKKLTKLKRQSSTRCRNSTSQVAATTRNGKVKEHHAESWDKQWNQRKDDKRETDQLAHNSGSCVPCKKRSSTEATSNLNKGQQKWRQTNDTIGSRSDMPSRSDTPSNFST